MARKTKTGSGGLPGENGSAWRNRIVGHADVNPEELTASPWNWRAHPGFQQSALSGILSQVGVVQDIIVSQNSGYVVDGHLRVLLALRTGQPTIPVTYVDLTEAEEKLILATLDPLAGLAAADDAKLAELLHGVQADDAAVVVMLAKLAEDNGLFKAEPKEDAGPQIDKADELRQKWGVKVGQVWQLGEHRLACGDCTDRAVVDAVMQGERAALVVTDPPYGVEYADKNAFLNTIAPGNRIQERIKGDHGSKDETQSLWRAAFEQMGAVMAPGAAIYCFMPQGGDQMMMMMMMMMGAGIEPRHELIWLKNNHVLGRVDYAYKHEPILYAWKDGGHKFYGEFQTSILEFPKPQKSDLHPTTKPVELIERLISNSSLSGDVVLDGFVGSGTTLIACERLGRKCRAIELDPGYCGVTIQRWVDMTGGEPVLLSDL